MQQEAHNNVISVVDNIVNKELVYAETKHPVFPKGFGGVVIILEELGELATECNDKWHPETAKRSPADVDLAMAQEAAQVAVTAIRFLRTAVANGLDVNAVLAAIDSKTAELQAQIADSYRKKEARRKKQQK